MKRRSLIAILWLFFLSGVMSFRAGADSGSPILTLTIDDQITPISSEIIRQAIDRAEAEKAEVLILELSTPGGLDTSMREIVQRILSSLVPVVVYVNPSGARAASAGFVILLAADVAAMAQGTNTGAAHPVDLTGEMEKHKTLFTKIENDAAAYVRTLAENRGRNVEAAEKAVRESRSYNEVEALNEKLIEIIAKDRADLLAQLNGRKIRRFNGQEAVIQTQGKSVVAIDLSWRQKLLSFLVNPQIAFVLFAIGALCLYFEFNNPGAIAPGVVGALSIILALYGFHFLPINVTGVLLIALSLVLFVLEAKVQAFGILGAGGIAAMIIGGLILIDAPSPELRIGLPVVASVAVPFGLIMIFLLRLAIAAHKMKVVTGDVGMIGLVGVAETDLDLEGSIFVRGELWRAVAKTRVSKGEQVRVTGIKGLMLEVEPETALSPPKQASAVTLAEDGKAEAHQHSGSDL